MRGELRLEARVHAAPALPNDPAPYAGPDSYTFVRLKVHHPAGLTGEGFTGRFLAAEVAHCLNETVAPLVAETDPLSETDPTAPLARLNPRGMTGVVISALSAFEIACIDLRAKAKGQSVAAMLGGKRGAAPAHVTCGFPALDLDALVATCTAEIDAGAAGVKVLVAAKGRTPEEDALRVRAVRSAIGDAPDLIVDANCGWDCDAALAFMRATTDLSLIWLEEPVRGNDRRTLATLAATGIHPIGAGQMEQSADRFLLLAEAGVSVIQPNAVFCGGFGAAIALAAEAQRAGRIISPAGGWDAINVHWACGALDTGPVELHRGQTRIARLLGADQSLNAGMLSPPDAPGLGLDPDEQALDACAL